MRILFLGYRYSYFRNFDSVLRELANRGHEIHLAVEQDHDHGQPLVEALAAECPAISFGVAPERDDDDWSWVAQRLRHGLEYFRYQHKLFDDTPQLRDRSRERTPGLFVALGNVMRRYARWARRPATLWLQWLERAIPDAPAIHDFIRRQAPDVVLITPLVGLGSSQIDYLRAAKSLRIPTGLCVWSWDHLSSKALIRELPDRVFVWNDTQKREAIEMHGVPANRIAVTGAQCFDKWFDRTPSRDRDTFRAAAGLPLEGPLVLYVCSAPFAGSLPEAPFVVEWIRRVRAHPSALRTAPILVRPHPARIREWESIVVRQFPGVAVWGGDPMDPASRHDYFDSLFHSTVVVGLNTSAFIEGGIVGRPIHTVLLPEWHESQMGTLHFRYLLEAGGGLLIAATSFDEHLGQLACSLAEASSERRPFIQAFVRPLGLNVAATPRFVDEVESLRLASVTPPQRPPFEWLARRWLRKAIGYRDDVKRERWVYSEREREKIERMRAHEESKAEKRGRERTLAARGIRGSASGGQTARARGATAAEDANGSRDERLKGIS